MPFPPGLPFCHGGVWYELVRFRYNGVCVAIGCSHACSSAPDPSRVLSLSEEEYRLSFEMEVFPLSLWACNLWEGERASYLEEIDSLLQEVNVRISAIWISITANSASEALIEFKADTISGEEQYLAGGNIRILAHILTSILLDWQTSGCLMVSLSPFSIHSDL